MELATNKQQENFYPRKSLLESLGIESDTLTRYCKIAVTADELSGGEKVFCYVHRQRKFDEFQLNIIKKISEWFDNDLLSGQIVIMLRNEFKTIKEKIKQ